jgi:hypothetical protein
MTVKQFVSVSLLMASTFAAGAWVYGKYQHQSALAVNFPLASSVFKPTKAAEKMRLPQPLILQMPRKVLPLQLYILKYLNAHRVRVTLLLRATIRKIMVMV